MNYESQRWHRPSVYADGKIFTSQTYDKVVNLLCKDWYQVINDKVINNSFNIRDNKQAAALTLQVLRVFDHENYNGPYQKKTVDTRRAVNVYSDN